MLRKLSAVFGHHSSSSHPTTSSSAPITSSTSTPNIITIGGSSNDIKRSVSKDYVASSTASASHHHHHSVHPFNQPKVEKKNVSAKSPAAPTSTTVPLLPCEVIPAAPDWYTTRRQPLITAIESLTIFEHWPADLLHFLLDFISCQSIVLIGGREPRPTDRMWVLTPSINPYQWYELPVMPYRDQVSAVYIDDTIIVIPQLYRPARWSLYHHRWIQRDEIGGVPALPFTRSHMTCSASLEKHSVHIFGGQFSQHGFHQSWNIGDAKWTDHDNDQMEAYLDLSKPSDDDDTTNETLTNISDDGNNAQLVKLTGSNQSRYNERIGASSITVPRGHDHGEHGLTESIWVMGGENDRRLLPLVERYDTTTREWKRMPDLIRARTLMQLVLIPHTGILALGGSVNHSAYGSLDVIELFSFTTQRWHMLSFKLPKPLVYFSACICDHILYISDGAVEDHEIGTTNMWMMEGLESLRDDYKQTLAWQRLPHGLPSIVHSSSVVVV